MTDWSDAEISRRLALAIGWPKVYYHQHHDGYYISVRDGSSIHFKRFDYRNPDVIWPIAERFDCFPSKVACGDTTGWLVLPGVASDIQPTAAKAVALAVIGARSRA